MKITHKEAGELVNAIIEAHANEGMGAIDKVAFKAGYLESLLAGLTVDSEFVASYLQERLDIVKEMRKLGKL
jgi:hypothetical protein